jgi:hypothetical protein
MEAYQPSTLPLIQFSALGLLLPPDRAMKFTVAP